MSRARPLFLALALVTACGEQRQQSDISAQWADVVENGVITRRMFMWLDQYPTFNLQHPLAGCWYFAEVEWPESLTSFDLKKLFIKKAQPATSRFIPSDIVRGQMDIRIKDLDILIRGTSDQGVKQAYKEEKKLLEKTKHAMWHLPLPGAGLAIHDQESAKLLPTSNAHNLGEWNWTEMQAFRGLLEQMDRQIDFNNPVGWVGELLRLELKSCARTPQEKVERGLKAARDPFTYSARDTDSPIGF